MNKVRDAFKVGFENVAKVGTCITSCILSKTDNGIILTTANIGDCEIAMFKSTDSQKLNDSIGLESTLSNSISQDQGENKDNGCQELVGYKLTEVHNANNPKEQDILYNLHPDEIDMFQLKNSAIQVKGMLIPTRSIGDLRLK